MSIGASNWERLAVWIVGLLVVAASLGIGFVGTPFTGSPDAVAAVDAEETVTISSMGDGYVLTPASGTAGDDGPLAGTALIFYPGARVHPTAYLPVLAPVVAETGLTVYIPKPTLNLAVFDQNMAGPIIQSNPAVDEWYVGGHSLGGAMACRYAARNPDQLSGLVLFGSYCDRDLAGTTLRVLSVQGGADTIVDRETYLANRRYLPADTVDRTIQGMNHTQFGAYSGQRGDASASISYEEAHRELRTMLVEFLEAESSS